MGDEQATQANANDGGQQSVGSQSSVGTQQAAKTFTQAELDYQIDERLKREREKYADYDRLKADATEYQKYLDSQKTEQERLQARLAEAEAARVDAERKANERLLRSEIISAAAKANFAEPGDAYALLDLARLKIKDDGTVEGLEDAIKKLVESKPYLIKRADGRVSSFNPGNPSGGPETDAQRVARLRTQSGQGPIGPFG